MSSRRPLFEDTQPQILISFYCYLSSQRVLVTWTRHFDNVLVRLLNMFNIEAPRIPSQ